MYARKNATEKWSPATENGTVGESYDDGVLIMLMRLMEMGIISTL